LVHFKAFADDGWRATLTAKIDIRVPDAAEAERLSVHGKARCRAEGTIETSTASVDVSRLDTWDMDFFSGHDDVPFDQCQINLRLGGDSGALYVPLGTFCYANDATSSGPCAQPVTVRVPKTTKPGLAMLGVSVKLDDGHEVDFELQPTRNAGHELEVLGRAVCKVGKQHYMESGSHSFEGGAFDFEPGEVYGGEFTVFDDDKWSDLELEKATCQLSFEAKDVTLYGEEHPHRFHTACLTEGTVKTGPCEGFPAAAFVEVEASMRSRSRASTLRFPAADTRKARRSASRSSSAPTAPSAAVSTPRSSARPTRGSWSRVSAGMGPTRWISERGSRRRCGWHRMAIPRTRTR
ncbi:MAG: hypothetical protein JKY37_15555, partial [Nannocystaceae bacterium]|nr:hypothetical protein [Nannocystaceae bacterium]